MGLDKDLSNMQPMGTAKTQHLNVDSQVTNMNLPFALPVKLHKHGTTSLKDTSSNSSDKLEGEVMQTTSSIQDQSK